MTKFLIINLQKLKIFLCCVLCISLLLFVSACGEADHSSSDTGSISFSVVWRGAPTIKDAAGLVVTRALDCNTSGVATVEAEIYDENNDYLVSGGPWNCSAHAGTIENVPEGSNRKAVILGKDSSGAIVYQGEKTGISVTAGQTTNAGTIVVDPVNTTPTSPTNVNATAGDGQVTISWDSVSGATSYNIYWATWSGVSKTYHEDTHSPDTPANPDTTVFDRVLSYNGHTYAVTKYSMTWDEANTLSDQHGGYLVTINDAQENSFLTQNYFSFLSELWIGYNDKDNEGTWVWANGETSTYTNWDAVEPNGAEYESCACIYPTGKWNDLPCANLIFAIVEWEPVAATSYTHTGLTNGTTYYYVVTAANNYGESDESSEVSATPSATGTAPSAPVNVSATAGDGQVTISWDSVSGATSYNIYLSTSAGVTISTGTKISDVTSPYTHTGLTNDTTYYYVVTAENSYGESDESNQVSATPSSGDDNYEENDTLATAYDLSSDEYTWLWSIDGNGVQADDDWYKIYVTLGYERVIVDLQFTHADGDIDVALYDAWGTWIVGSSSSTDNEYIDHTVPVGGTDYYIKVYYGNQGNTYDFWWDDYAP